MPTRDVIAPQSDDEAPKDSMKQFLWMKERIRWSATAIVAQL
jgi:hypothetical protein